MVKYFLKEQMNTGKDEYILHDENNQLIYTVRGRFMDLATTKLEIFDAKNEPVATINNGVVIRQYWDMKDLNGETFATIGMTKNIRSNTSIVTNYKASLTLGEQEFKGKMRQELKREKDLLQPWETKRINDLYINGADGNPIVKLHKFTYHVNDRKLDTDEFELTIPDNSPVTPLVAAGIAVALDQNLFESGNDFDQFGENTAKSMLSRGWNLIADLMKMFSGTSRKR